jgi:hypothetical protein
LVEYLVVSGCTTVTSTVPVVSSSLNTKGAVAAKSKRLLICKRGDCLPRVLGLIFIHISRTHTHRGRGAEVGGPIPVRNKAKYDPKIDAIGPKNRTEKITGLSLQSVFLLGGPSDP